jgi:hypothetical protein
MPSTPDTELGRFRTWHFTSVLKSFPDIILQLEQIASQQYSLDKVLASCALVRWHIENEILMTAARPDCVTFVSCRFLRTDVAAWMSNAASRTPSPDLALEGYIQSKSAIGLDRLHNWLKDAKWKNVGGKLCASSAYQQFCEANDLYAYCNVGSHAVAKGGRPATTKLKVCSDQCNAFMIVVFAQLPCARQFPPS